jgi:hypothetical protein
MKKLYFHYTTDDYHIRNNNYKKMILMRWIFKEIPDPLSVSGNCNTLYSLKEYRKGNWCLYHCITGEDPQNVFVWGRDRISGINVNIFWFHDDYEILHDLLI